MAVWLNYGLTQKGALVCVDDVRRGRSELRCPYCMGPLTAKKGRKVTHHFAHTEQTCAAVADRSHDGLPLLPLYTDFAPELGKRELAELVSLWDRYGIKGRGASEPYYAGLVNGDYLKFNRFMGRSGGYEFAKVGKVPVGGLSIPLFADIQQERLRDRLHELEDDALYDINPNPTASHPSCNLTFPAAFGDYRLYRAQLQRVLSKHLYFLKVQTADADYYKIGVASRPIHERIAEIKAELQGYIGTVTIELLGLWQHCGRVEHYFKYRFRHHNQRIGMLTEYFSFDEEQAAKTLRELRRLKSKQKLSPWEASVLSQAPSELEREVEVLKAAYEEEMTRLRRRQRRSQAIRTGMKRAAKHGQHIGRPKGGESHNDFLAKPKNQAIARALRQNLSLRGAAKQTGASVNTVRKVAALLSDEEG